MKTTTSLSATTTADLRSDIRAWEAWAMESVGWFRAECDKVLSELLRELVRRGEDC